MGHTLSGKAVSGNSDIIVVAKGSGSGKNIKKQSEVILRNKLSKPCQNGSGFGKHDSKEWNTL